MPKAFKFNFDFKPAAPETVAVDPCGGEMEQLLDELHVCRNQVTSHFAAHGARMNAIEEVMKSTGASIGEAATSAAAEAALDAEADAAAKTAFADVLVWASVDNKPGEAPQNVEALQAARLNMETSFQPADRPIDSEGAGDMSAQREADEKEAAEWAAAQLFAGGR